LSRKCQKNNSARREKSGFIK